MTYISIIAPRNYALSNLGGTPSRIMDNGGSISIEINAEALPVIIRIDKIKGSKIDINVNLYEFKFDIEAKLDEENRTNDELTIRFLMVIRTKPSLAKYEVGGKAVISGGREVFDAALEMDESTQFPKILHTIYQRVYESLYLVSSVIKSPYPPPDLIHNPIGAHEKFTRARKDASISGGYNAGYERDQSKDTLQQDT